MLQGLSQQALIPLTIAQYQKAMREPDMSVDGKDLKSSHMRFVGRIVAMEERSTQMVFTIEDSTGRADMSWWIDLDDNEFLLSRRASWAYVPRHAPLTLFLTLCVCVCAFAGWTRTCASLPR